MTTSINTKVDGLFIGRVQSPWPGRAPSAINKYPVSGPRLLTLNGFEGDEQADPRYHGGPDKAVHHYPADHYPFWIEQHGKNSKFRAGGFGENVSTTGITEEIVCIGDVFSIGKAKLQLSQGRQPCWKLNVHSGIENLSHQVMQTKYTGWYYRVVEEGCVEPGDSLRLIHRNNPTLTVKRVSDARFSPRKDLALAKVLAKLPDLAQSWREVFAKLV